MKRKIKLPNMDAEKVSKQIGDFVIKKVLAAGSTGCVIGLSGGIDSTTTASLIKRAFDQYNATSAQKLELIGYMLPSKLNPTADESDAEKVAKTLGIRYEVINIEPAVEAFRQTNGEAFSSRFNLGNMISRVRANVLSTKAATEHKTLAGTGNKDEDFGVGYYTLFGDGAVHLSPIGGLSKRLVRQMAEYLGVDKSLVMREPTAGLEAGQTDFKDLGYGYDLVELVTEGLTQGFGKQKLSNNEQVVDLAQRQIDLYAAKFGAKKFTSVDAVVSDILSRNKVALAKAEIIHPPSPEISLEYI